MDGFVVELPSNASLDVFPQNTLTNFTTKLSQPLPLDGKMWSVGLMGMQYSQSWHNLTNAYIRIKQEGGDYRHFPLEDGFYETVNELIEKIHMILSSISLEKVVTLHYDKLRDRVLVRIYERGIDMILSESVCNVFGMAQCLGNSPLRSGVHVGDMGTDITQGFHSLFVYSDIVEDQIVGDTKVPLLRIVPITDSRARGYQSREFTNIIYRPVVSHRGDTIKVVIRRDNGQSVPFESGKVLLTLHFKPL